LDELSWGRSGGERSEEGAAAVDASIAGVHLDDSRPAASCAPSAAASAGGGSPKLAA
jgi:hypothetical protein